MILKFRAFDKNKGTMHIVEGFDFINQSISVRDDDTPKYFKKLYLDNSIVSIYFKKLYLDNSIVLMQSTGHMDINGVEIYDGDILQSEHFFTYQVVFKGDCWRCEPIKKKYFKNRFIGNDLKIIGNVYQNKELLEVK